MSKINKYNKYMYPSIKAALNELSAPYMLKSNVILGYTYTKKAAEEMAAFLCINNIPHTFTTYMPNTHLSARLVMVCWNGANGEENLGWWEQMEDIK